jgi:ATP-binding cassette subfamily B protein
MRPMHAHGAIGHDPTRIEGQQVSRSVLRRAWDFARPYKLALIGFLAAIIAGALMALIPPLLFRRIIDVTLPNDDRSELLFLALLVVVAALAEAAVSLFERRQSAQIGEGVIFDLRVALFDHVQRLPISFFTRTQTGALVSRLNNDVIGAQRALTGTLGSVVSNVIVLTTTLIAMLALDWKVTLLALLLLPLFLIPAKRVGRKIQAITRESMDHNAALNSTMTERFGVSGALLVKLFGSHDEEAGEFSDRARRVRDIGIKNAVYTRTFLIALGLVGAIGTAAVYYVGGNQVISGAITAGTLVALATYVTRIYQPLTALTNARVDVMTALVSFERVFDVLDTVDPLADRPDAIDLPDPVGRVEFDDVTFTYPAAEDDARVESLEVVGGADRPLGPTLRDVSFVAEPGTTVALVGPSGAGKTTLTTLLPRLYRADQGAVRIDGHDVLELTRDSLRSAIGVVSQDPHLFHESVRSNLRFARPDATDQDLVAAATAARIHDVIASLPDGYDTIVGERGYRLSGGEKQRLAIARLLLKDPAIVVLDEATSHLDSENEALVQEALREVLSGRTALVIAHRLSTIVEADQILVMEAGRILQRGSHRELLETGGLYADLWTTLIGADDRSAPRPV